MVIWRWNCHCLLGLANSTNSIRHVLYLLRDNLAVAVDDDIGGAGNDALPFRFSLCLPVLTLVYGESSDPAVSPTPQRGKPTCSKQLNNAPLAPVGGHMRFAVPPPFPVPQRQPHSPDTGAGMLKARPPIAPVAPLSPPPAPFAAPPCAVPDLAALSEYPTGASKSTFKSVSTMPTAFDGFSSFTSK